METLSNIKKYIVQNKVYIIACIICSIFLSRVLALYFDSDILWHYKLGEEIIKNKAISSIDSFSWQPNLIWGQHEWLYDVIIFIVVRFTGLVGFLFLYILNQFLIIFICGILNKSKNKVLYTIIAMTFMNIFPMNCSNRPSEFSIWLLLISILLYNKEVKYKKLKYFILVAFTANFHGGTLLTLISAYIIISVIDILSEYREKSKINTYKLLESIITLLIMMFGSVLNPSGFHVIKQTLVAPTLPSTQLIEEWAPLSANVLSALGILIIALSMGYSLYKYKFNRNNMIEVGLIYAFIVLSLISQKGLIQLNILWLALGYKYLEELVIDFFKFNKEQIDKHIKIFNFKVVMPAFTILLFFSLYQLISSLGGYSFKNYVNTRVSEKVLEYLNDNKDKKTIHSCAYGNWLIYNDIKCFVDSRQFPYDKTLSSSDSMNDLILLSYLKEDTEMDKILDKYDFDYIRSSEDFNIDWYLKSNDKYKLIIEDTEKNERLYERIK